MIINRRTMLLQSSAAVVTVLIGVADAANAMATKYPVIDPRRRPRRTTYRSNRNQKFTSIRGHHTSKHISIDDHHRDPHRCAEHLRAYGTLDTPGNRRDLALTMWGEARGYGIQGMRCIGHVIMNRVKLEQARFGKGIHGVCYKRKQFSCHNLGDPNRQRMLALPHMDPNNPDWLAFVEADKLAGRILAGIDPDNTVGATFYFAENMVPYWIDDMTVVGVMFGHIFCKEKKFRTTRKPHKRRKNRHTRRGYCRLHHRRHKSLRRVKYHHKKV